MSKSVSKFLCALLALILVFASVACLAETVRRSYYTYTKNDSKTHFVVVETWEYRVDEDGELVSGIPVGASTYIEDHDFDDGKCIYCGYKKHSKKKKTSDTTETTVPTNDTFTTASGITVTAGTPAATALKQVFAAIPDNTEVSFKDVDAEVAEALVAAINGDASAAELLEILEKFPQQIVDGTSCYVVTISYTDAADKSVVENYAFSTADATLVKVF